MWSQIWDARIISARSKNAMQNDYRSGRPTHGSGDPRSPKTNLNHYLKTFLQFFKGFQEHRGAQSFEAKKIQSTFDLGAIEIGHFRRFPANFSVATPLQGVVTPLLGDPLNQGSHLQPLYE